MAAEDHVIREISVFHSSALQDQLCLIQYPQRPSTHSMANTEIIQARIKPEQLKIQLTLQMDTESDLYDPEMGEKLAEAEQGIGLNEDEYMPDHRLKMDRTTMESTVVPKLTEDSRYNIGVLQNGQITLTPLKSIVQMKTVFPYLNKADKARAAHLKEQGADTEDETEETEATKVTVKFSRTNAAQAARGPAKISSYTARKKDEEEPWTDLQYVHHDPSEYEKLCSANLETETPFYVVSQKDYLSKLFPKYTDTATEGSADKKKNHNPKMSVQLMRTMTVPEQLRVLLLNAKLLQYHQVVDFLKTKLKSEFDDTSLLRSIQTVGILVQGCWVVRSDVLYPEDYKSGANGISGVMMQHARDIILSNFTENRFVERKKMIAATKLPTEEVTEILSQVSRMVPKQGWEFALACDSKFISSFPEVVQRQSLIWEMKKNQRVRKPSNAADTPSSPPRRRRSRNLSFSGDDSGLDSDNQGARRRPSDSAGGRRQRRTSTRSDIGIPSKSES